MSSLFSLERVGPNAPIWATFLGVVLYHRPEGAVWSDMIPLDPWTCIAVFNADSGGPVNDGIGDLRSLHAHAVPRT